MEYQEYPKVMNHPDHKPARKIADAMPAGQGGHFGQPEQWEPERFPQITVSTADDEEYYASKGYRAAGKIDPDAFSTANASPYVAGRKTAEWPKMVNGRLMQDPNAPTSTFAEFPKWLTPPDGGEAVLVKSADEEEAMLARWTAPPEEKPKSRKSEARAQ